MTEELKSAMREASESLSAAIEDMADKINAVLASRNMKLAARSVLADKLRKAASQKDLNWQTLFDALCVKSRSEAVSALAAMIDPKGMLTERERQILGMWPRFEDGEPVWYGDEVDNMRSSVIAAEFFDGSITLSSDFDHLHLSFGERLNRPAPKVLDADGVEIKVGDTVWHEDGSEWLVEEMNRYGVRCFDGGKRRTFIPAFLTHTRPDSWERLEEDACNSICEYFGKGVSECDGCPANAIAANSDEFECCERAVKLDLIRRAKALAGIGVGE